MEIRRKYLILVAMVVILGVFILVPFSGIYEEPAIAKTKGLTISSNPINFGTIKPGEKVVRRVELKNRGVIPVRIRNIITQCGCLVSQLSNSELKPQETATLNLTFDSKGFFRRVKKQILIVTDDPNNSSIPITFEGYVKCGVKIDTDIVDFGRGRKGDILEGEINVFRDSNLDVGEVNVSCEEGNIVATIGKWEKNDDIDQCRIKIRKELSDQKLGVYTNTATIVLGDNVRYKVKLFYEVISPIQQAPLLVRIALNSGPGNNLVDLKWPKGEKAFFGEPSSTYGKCKVEMRSIGPEHSVLLVSPIGHKIPKENDFDIVKVPYRTLFSNRLETLKIPVSFVSFSPSTTKNSSRNE